MPDSLATRVRLQSVAGVALSALMRGCAEIGARLSGYTGQPPQCGRGGFFGTPEGLRGRGCRTLWLYGPDSTAHVAGVAFIQGAAQRWVTDSLATRVRLHSAAGVALSTLFGLRRGGCRTLWLYGSASKALQEMAELPNARRHVGDEAAKLGFSACAGLDTYKVPWTLTQPGPQHPFPTN